MTATSGWRADLAQKLHAAQTRHQDVRHHERELPLPQQIERLARGGDRFAGIVLAEGGLDKPAHGRLVVNDEDAPVGLFEIGRVDVHGGERRLARFEL